jgi:hypothetical protein
LSTGKKININELFCCNKCINTLYTIKKSSVVASASIASSLLQPEPMEVEDDNAYLTLDNILFTGSGHKLCVVCRAPIASAAVVMPKSARLDLLLLHRLFAPHGARCCISHLLNNNRLRPDQPISIANRLPVPTTLSPDQARELFNDLLSLIDASRTVSHLDFDDPSLNNEDYQAWTGWTKEQFDSIYEKISSYLRSSSNRTSRNTFAIFWIKLKTNLSFRQIGSLFNMHGDSEARRKRVADAFDTIRELLILHLVPQYLGIGHLTIDDAKAHNTAYTKVRSEPKRERSYLITMI